MARMQFADVRVNLYIRLLLPIVLLLRFLPLNQCFNLLLRLSPLTIQIPLFFCGVSGDIEVLLAFLVAVLNEFLGIECSLAGEGGFAFVLLESVDIVFLHQDNNETVRVLLSNSTFNSMCGCLKLQGADSDRAVRIGGRVVVRESKLAEGAYGQVWKCREGEQLFALKEIRLQSGELKEMFEKEVRILKQLKSKRSRHTVGIEGHSVSEGEIGRILLEFGTITLFDEISSRRFSREEYLSILLEIAICLEEVHSIGLSHLDLKPQNLVLVNGRYKLCDFGSAIEKPVKMDELDRKGRSRLQDYLESNSTLIYRSPEMVMLEKGEIGASSDVWMIGCIAFFMHFRKHPFEGQGKLAIVSAVNYSQQSDITDLIKTLLQIQQERRPTATEVRMKIEEMISKG